MEQTNDIEILAPAGSLESLRAAIQAGANAVYFGVEQLNMRARSSYNFSVSDLKEIAAVTRENGIKAYLTLPLAPRFIPRATYYAGSTRPARAHIYISGVRSIHL